VTVGPAILDRHGLLLDPAEIAQSLPERRDLAAQPGCAAGVEKADPRSRCRLSLGDTRGEQEQDTGSETDRAHRCKRV